MAYAGYRLKINGAVFPNAYMQRGTWSAQFPKTLVRSWRNTAGVLKEDYYPDKKATIAFSIKEHETDEHSEIAAFFKEKENVVVEVWDDDDSEYRTIKCKIGTVKWAHSNAITSRIVYKATSIKITEY